MKIWKWYVSWANLNGVTFAQMPEQAKILSCAAQGEGVAVWFMCDPSKPMESRPLTIVGTGHNCPAVAPFVGTIVHPDSLNGNLVMHIFDGME